MTPVSDDAGYPLVLLLVAAETAGALVPGETALIATAILAARGHSSLPLVIAAGSAGAILGDHATGGAFGIVGAVLSVVTLLGLAGYGVRRRSHRG